jgi:hypothetical protein
MSRSALAPLVVALFSLSCSSTDEAPQTVVADTGDLAVEDTFIEETPEPCGVTVGETFCDHTLVGYARVGETEGLATDVPYGSHTISEILAMGSQKYVYVYASAYW